MKKWKETFWPIERSELKRVLPMALMMFCFLFNYTVMRDLKDTLILTHAGAEAIPFLKFWGTLPCSVLFVLLYAKLSNILRPKVLYTVTIIPFFLFFIGFGFVFYPLREFFHPSIHTEVVLGWFPQNMQHTGLAIISLFKNWTYALFYIMSELWGSMGISLLFWQFANSITSTDEAKRFYPRFTQLGNLSLIVSGYAVLYFSNLRLSLPAHIDSWGVTLKWLTGIIGLNCVILLITYHSLQRKIEVQSPASKKEKPKLSLKESFLYLTRSKYLGLIALLVLAYGISINLLDVIFKSQLKLYYPTEGELSAFTGKLSMSIGLTTLLMVQFSSFVLSRISWRAAAFFTPAFVMIVGGIFFGCIFFKESLGALFHISPLLLAVLVGSLQYSTSKGMKYALFDPTKEMAYIPLDAESKVKGKAAIDVIGGRLGKSGGSLFLQFVLLFGSLMDNLYLLYAMIILIGGIWIASVFKLDGLYQEKLQEKAATSG